MQCSVFLSRFGEFGRLEAEEIASSDASKETSELENGRVGTEKM
jgi:hypothetical protein